jgi:hypothetical protein
MICYDIRYTTATLQRILIHKDMAVEIMIEMIDIDEMIDEETEEMIEEGIFPSVCQAFHTAFIIVSTAIHSHTLP